VEAPGSRDQEAARAKRPSRRKKILIGVLVAAVLVTGGSVAAYVALRDDSPPPASLKRLPPVSKGGSSAAAGSWTLVADGTSFVGYRVRERIGPIVTPGDAVGRSTKLSGELVIDGANVTSVRVTADMTKLKSNVDIRDNAMKGNGLETDKFKQARFELARPIENPSSRKGEIVKSNAVGNLTLHGVTRSVEAKVEARWSGEFIQVAGSIPIRLNDFGIDVDTAAAFAGLHVDGRGIAEFELVFAPKASTRRVGKIDSLRDDPAANNPFREPDAPCKGENTTGGSIVFTSGSDTANGDDLWTVNTDGSDLVRLTNTPNIAEIDAAVSPDGSLIAYSHIDAASGLPTVWLMRADGSGQHQLITGEPPAQLAPAWSPDGSRLVFTGGNLETPGDAQLFAANVDGTDVRRITASDGRFHGAAAWSPSGRTIAFESYGQEGADELFTVPAMGGESKRLTDDPAYDSSPEWLDEDHLVFLHDDRLASTAVQTGTMTLLDASSKGYGQPRVSRDAKALLLNRNGNFYTTDADGKGRTCIPAGRSGSNGDWLANPAPDR
jgi:polyisoprenoid-binding protein YceI